VSGHTALSGTPRPSVWRIWWLAARPRTLGASLVPVALGAALAFHAGAFSAPVLVVCAMAAIALQIATNLANDAFDYLGAIDTQDRVGPVRVTQAGWLRPGQVFMGVGCAIGLALGCGVYLVGVGGAPILWIGIASIVAALAYSAGPFPLASHGLGELVAFAFFGVIATGGAAYLHVGHGSALHLLASLPIGFLVAALMVVNNLRDIETDAQSGKRTLAVRIGARSTRRLYRVLVWGALVACVPLALAFASIVLLLPLCAFPLARQTLATVARADDSMSFGAALAETARLHAAFGVLLCLALVLSA